jgi:hypothetical protein
VSDRRFYEAPSVGARRSAPAALRNREPIAEVLADWLPTSGLVLEVASGTGEHVVYFARALPQLEWQPSDIDEDSLRSIRAWRAEAGLANIREPVVIDAAAPDWTLDRADAVLNTNMVHISPWAAALGLLDGAQKVLEAGAPLILYGPWLTDSVPTAPSNLAFDADLRRRNPEWGLRRIEHFAGEAQKRDFDLIENRQMPANNVMLLFRKRTVATGL